MKTHRSTFDPAYLQWHAQFTDFETGCFEKLSEFVRLHFDDLLDRFYRLGHESLKEFPAWAFERYLRHIEHTSAREGAQ